MFEDIYKKTNSTSSSSVWFSIEFKEERWEEIKKDPKKLGDTIRFIIDGIVGLSTKSHRAVFTDFEFLDSVKKLRFDFELYDTADEGQNKIYLDKKKHEENMEQLDELKDVKPGDNNDEVISTMDNN